MKRGGGKGGKSQKTSYSKAIKTQAKTNTRQAKVNETKQKISDIQTKKKKLETQRNALVNQKKISKKEKKLVKLEKKQAKKEAKLAKRQQKLIKTQKKLNDSKKLAGINTKTAEGIKQQEDFAKAVTAFKTRVETRKINKTQRKLKRKQTKSKAKAKRLAKLTDKREKQLKKQGQKLGFFGKIFNKFKFTKKVSKSNIKQADINSKSSNANVKYYTNKVETLQLKKAKKEAQENKTKTITSVDELKKDQNGKLIIPKLKNEFQSISQNIKENEKYLGIDLDAISEKDNRLFKDDDYKLNFILNIKQLKREYQTEYSKLMEKDELNNGEKETLLKLIEINREYGLNFS